MQQPTKTGSLRQAQQFIDQGRVAPAIAIYQKILEEDPSDLGALSMLGDLYVKAGRITDGVEHFLRIAEKYFRSGSASSATYVLKKALKIDATNPLAHMNLGELLLRDKKVEQAHDSFIEAGAAFWHKGNIKAAFKMNTRALEVMPGSRQAKGALSLIQREMDRSEPQAPKKEPRKRIISDLPDIIISIADGSDAVCAPMELCDDQAPLAAASGSGASPSQGESLPAKDEDAIVEQIAHAEFLVGCGQLDQAIGLLRATLQGKPDDIQIREKLKDIYLRSEMMDRASEECVNIAAIFIARGETVRAADYVARARLLCPPPAKAQTNEVNQPEEAQDPNSEWGSELTQSAAVM